MMALHFGRQSERHLETVAPSLQNLMRQALALELIDFSITEGFRPRYVQDEYYSQGKSKVRWPHSRHNAQPYAMAVDAAPYVRGKISYDYRHCCFLAGVILGLAKKISVHVRWGGNWDMDLEPVTDQDFQDLVHYELYK